MKSSVKSVSPALAKEWLVRNVVNNRKLRPAWVTYLAEQMRAGNWHPTGDAVCFRVGDNALLNGQHRLHAVIRADISIKMLVVEDVTETAFLHMDRGAGRTISDVTGLSHSLASDAALLNAIMIGRAPVKRRATEEKLLAIADWWGPTHDLLLHGSQSQKAKSLYNSPARIAFGLRWATAIKPDDRSYIRDQWHAFIGSNAPDMSKATATIWKRMIQDAQTAGKKNDAVGRMNLLLAIYYGLDPARSDTAPHVRSNDDIYAEVREWVLQLEDAYRTNTPDGEHPYLFAAWNKGLRPGRKHAGRGRPPKVSEIQGDIHG
jgi:hypothetical protein